MSVIIERKIVFFLCRLAVGLLALVLIVGTVIPLLHSNAWWVRIFDFPRVQIALLTGLTLAGYVALRLYGSLGGWDYALAALVGLALVWQLISIAPYTALYPKEMSASRAEDDSNRISLLVFNVLSDNRDVAALRDLIRDTDPDIILLSEPDQWWLEQLDGLEDDYPYTLLQPQDNDYGMLLYSRLKLKDPEVRFLIDPAVPSFRAQVRLRSGSLVTFYGVHPRPPGIERPDEEQDSSREKTAGEEGEDGDRVDSDVRDAELLLIASEVKELGSVPVIVAGDFNDVAWSRTTHQFQRIGGLLDPRVGRGLLNTFDTRSRFLRYPLDYAFASRHFLLAELHRLPDIGSDHFPIFAVFDYNPESLSENDPPQPDAGDAREADEAIEEGKSND
ncbi:endonuclease [Guyparkeria sp. SCN-R1]|uniref:endonuclease/exonuclease/phosphatase family protein n=1 Tax=Guyparkeria sp. SCN-R1 TaxID=2341113 RepID=UPI000F651EA9|nr:endonuclease/exonuclease/phosphatase family protein [Guyparkeria sp. SCN-R1]RRQ23278.1 endonuclease [Guyparkeria sp. SCN-R1]